MKKVLYTLAALSFVFVACNKQEIVPEEGTSQEGELTTVTIKASNGDADTKAAISDGLAFTWTIGDQIAVHTDAGRFYTSEALTTGGATADFTVSLSGTRDGYAVYPASVAKSYSESTLTLTLPSEYTFAQVSGDNTPLPMIADNTSAALSFYHVTGLLRLTITNIPTGTNKIKLDFNGKKVSGDFTISSPSAGSSSIGSVPGTKGTNDIIWITGITGTADLTVNIPLPTGATYSDLTVSAWTSENVALRCQVVAFNTYSPVRAHGKKLYAALNLGPFSVADGKYVIIAPGNLYTESGTLKMAANYYDYIYAFSSNGDYANNADTYNANNRTHFNYNETYYLMKGEPLNNTKAYTNQDSYDLSRSDIEGGKSWTWRVPSNEDWKYLLLTSYVRPGARVRNGSSAEYTSGWKFVKVLVSDMAGAGTSNEDGTAALAADATAPSTDYQAGLLIFPDNVDITGTFEILGDQNANAAFNTTKITKENLDNLVNAGCAFLPAVGRWYSTSFGAVGNDGSYWSCSKTATTDVYCLRFTNNYFVPHTSGAWVSDSFRSVRLIRDLN